MNPFSALELLFYGVFGQTTPEKLQVSSKSQPDWTTVLFKFITGVYLLLAVVVLINLLIAMMSDTYQRIQVARRVRERSLCVPHPKGPARLLALLALE